MGRNGGKTRAEANIGSIPLCLHVFVLFYTDLYDKDKVDIEHVSMEDVFVLLQCDDKGLTEEEAVRRIGIFGPNKVRIETGSLPLLLLGESRGQWRFLRAREIISA